MSRHAQRLGQASESIAVAYLKRHGYRILERNYRTPYGEVDIVATENGRIVFVEVKARRSRRFGDPRWAVSIQKQRHLSKAALNYLKTKASAGARARFDVIAIEYLGDFPEVKLIKNAFDLAYR